MMALGELILLAGLGAWLWLTILVNDDASKRGASKKGLWTLLTLLTGVFGAVAYILKRPPHPDVVKTEFADE